MTRTIRPPLLGALLILALAAGLVPAGAADPRGQKAPARNIGGPGDYALREKLIRRIANDPELSRLGLSLALVNGGAVFSGHAATWTQKRRALTLAATSRGIVNVTDQVQIARGEVKDEALQKALSALLVDQRETLGMLEIEVRVQDGTATLSGTVKDFARRVRAEEMAGTVLGVTRLVNRLRPANAPSGTDEASVRRALVSYLGDHREYPYSGEIEVQVDPARVTLRGRVPLFVARQQAATMAALVGGGREVENRIKVDPSVQMLAVTVKERP